MAEHPDVPADATTIAIEISGGLRHFYLRGGGSENDLRTDMSHALATILEPQPGAKTSICATCGKRWWPPTQGGIPNSECAACRHAKNPSQRYHGRDTDELLAALGKQLTDNRMAVAAAAGQLHSGHPREAMIILDEAEGPAFQSSNNRRIHGREQ